MNRLQLNDPQRVTLIRGLEERNGLRWYTDHLAEAGDKRRYNLVGLQLNDMRTSDLLFIKQLMDSEPTDTRTA